MWWVAILSRLLPQYRKLSACHFESVALIIGDFFPPVETILAAPRSNKIKDPS